MDRSTWRATVHSVAKSQTRLSNWACTLLEVTEAPQAWLASARGPEHMAVLDGLLMHGPEPQHPRHHHCLPADSNSLFIRNTLWLYERALEHTFWN